MTNRDYHLGNDTQNTISLNKQWKCNVDNEDKEILYDYFDSSNDYNGSQSKYHNNDKYYGEGLEEDKFFQNKSDVAKYDIESTGDVGFFGKKTISHSPHPSISSRHSGDSWQSWKTSEEEKLFTISPKAIDHEVDVMRGTREKESYTDFIPLQILILAIIRRLNISIWRRERATSFLETMIRLRMC